MSILWLIRKVRFGVTPKPTRGTRALPKLGNELLVRNGRLLAALRYDCQIFEVFQQFFVVGDWNNDGCTFAVFVGDVLNRIAHERKIRGKGADLQWQRESKIRFRETRVLPKECAIPRWTGHRPVATTSVKSLSFGRTF